MGCQSKGCGCGKTRDDLDHQKTLPVKVKKGWGYELFLHNGDGYCGKILHFNSQKACSMHLHAKKHETFYVSYGSLVLKTIDTKTGTSSEIKLSKGDVFVVKQLLPHQLFAVEESEIFEMSTEDDVNDSYRVWKGDSQK